jgi:hypothetical protein
MRVKYWEIVADNLKKADRLHPSLFKPGAGVF